MQHVKVSWLRILNYSLVFVTVLIYGQYFLFNYLDVSQEVQERWGVDTFILVLGALHAVFVIVSDRLMRKRSAWLMTLISISLYAALIASIIEYTGNTNIFYRLCYVALVFFSAMNGVFLSVAIVTFTWVILIFVLTGLATPTNASLTFNIVINSIMTLSALLGWLTFKKYYVSSAKESMLEGKLHEEQFKTGAILESITDGVLVVDNKFIIQIANASAASMLGCEKKDAEGKDYRTLLKPIPDNDMQADSEVDAITKTFELLKPSQQLNKLNRVSGKTLYVDIVASPIYQKHKNLENKEEQIMTGVIAVLRDVDKQKRAEQQRSDFISTASHEMRTPLASAQGFLELALNPKLASVDKRGEEYLHKAHSSVVELGGLFQDLLTTSQSEDGRLSYVPSVIEVVEFAHEIGAQGLVTAQNSGSEVEFTEDIKLQNDEKVYVYADPDRLRQVLINLIDNAYKYTKQGTVTLGLSVEADDVIFRVTDTGMGVPTEDVEHIFQKFYRIDNSETREIGGTGLGLFICKQIVDMMQGRIWVESKSGEGSIFHVQIPRIADQEVVEVKSPVA